MSFDIKVETKITVTIKELVIELSKVEAEELLNKLIYQIIPSTDEDPAEINQALKKLFWR